MQAVVDGADDADVATARLWRVSMSGRVGMIVFCLVFVLLGFALVTDGETGDRIVGSVVLVVAPAPSWFAAWRPYILLTSDEVVVQNPLRQHRIPLGAIKGATAGYYGVSLDVRGRALPVTAWAVQKMNLSIWSRRTTRADAVAAAILAAAGCSGTCVAG